LNGKKRQPLSENIFAESGIFAVFLCRMKWANRREASQIQRLGAINIRRKIFLKTPKIFSFYMLFDRFFRHSVNRILFYSSRNLAALSPSTSL